MTDRNEQIYKNKTWVRINKNYPQRALAYGRYLIFPVEKADGRGQGDEWGLKGVAFPAALDGFTGHTWQVGELGELGQGVFDAVQGTVQDFQDIVS